MNKKVCIIGTGGFARETLSCLVDSMNGTKDSIKNKVVFMEDDRFYSKNEIMGIPVIRLSNFKVDEYKVVVAIGDPHTRKRVVEELPDNVEYTTVIHPSAVISEWVEIGQGSIITAGTILTCNIKVGKHAHLNLHTTIGHDCVIGDFFTTAPAVNISGNCKVGKCVYLGTNSSLKQGVELADNVIIGMGGIVLKSISKEGVYIGAPVKELIR